MPNLEANKEIVRRYQEAYNLNELDRLADLMAADVLTPKIMPGLPPGIEGAKSVHRRSLDGMPDFHTHIEDLIAEGDKVAARITMTGTHSGDFWGIPATGKRVKFTGVYIVRIDGGRIVEHWGEEDSMGLLQQLGVMP